MRIDLSKLIDQVIGGLPGLPLFLLHLVIAVMVIRLILEIIQDWKSPNLLEPTRWWAVAGMVYVLSFR